MVLPTNIITIGDVHIPLGSTNLANAINFINTIPTEKIDLVVILGDIVDSNTVTNFYNAKMILDGLKVPYYVIQGNHDGMSTCYSNCGSESTCNFRNMFGSPDRVISVNGYQLIFVGMCSNETWKFDFNRSDIDKSRPTLIFNHGPVQPGRGSSSGYCELGMGLVCNDWGIYNYACSMKIETDKFTNLLGFYSGHVHCYSNQKIGGTLYVTEDNLGGNGPVGDYIGYTCLGSGGNSGNIESITYTRLNYNNTFSSQDPNCGIGIVCDIPVCVLTIN